MGSAPAWQAVLESPVALKCPAAVGTCSQALEEGLSCAQLCDKYFAIHKASYDWFDIQFERCVLGRAQQLCVCACVCVFFISLFNCW